METFQVIGATATMMLAVVGATWAMFLHFMKEVDKKFERVDQKFEVMNGRIFELAMALRPHIQEVQQQKVAV